MKALFTAVLLTLGLSAFAAEIKIYEAPAWRHDMAEGSFGINEELGRAWVELALSDRMSDSGPDYQRIKVEGLSLVGGSVVLAVEGQQVECAVVKTVGIFRTRVARATGNCKFVTRRFNQMVDDGFNLRRVPMMSVSIQTK
jgi:hypothetical protein